MGDAVPPAKSDVRFGDSAVSTSSEIARTQANGTPAPGCSVRQTLPIPYRRQLRRCVSNTNGVSPEVRPISWSTESKRPRVQSRGPAFLRQIHRPGRSPGPAPFIADFVRQQDITDTQLLLTTPPRSRQISTGSAHRALARMSRLRQEPVHGPIDAVAANSGFQRQYG